MTDELLDYAREVLAAGDRSDKEWRDFLAITRQMSLDQQIGILGQTVRALSDDDLHWWLKGVLRDQARLAKLEALTGGKTGA